MEHWSWALALAPALPPEKRRETDDVFGVEPTSTEVMQRFGSARLSLIFVFQMLSEIEWPSSLLADGVKASWVTMRFKDFNVGAGAPSASTNELLPRNQQRT